MSAADLPAIKADLERALAGSCTFSSLTPIQARLDAVDAARYRTTPPDMTNIADVDECYGERGGEKGRKRVRRGCTHLFSHLCLPATTQNPAFLAPTDLGRERPECT